MRAITSPLLAAGLLLVGVVTATGAAAGPVTGPAPEPPTATPAVATTPGAFNALTPTRVLDTRDGTGSTPAPLAMGTTRTLTVAGRGGVPSGPSTAVLTVTVTNPTVAGFLTVWSGGALPNVSNLNYVAGQTVANSVVVPVSSSGTVSYYANGAGVGSVDVLADVDGWFASGAPKADGAFGAVTPARLLDTRGSGGLAAGTTRTLPVLGGGVPSTADAVVLDVAVTDPGAAGYLTAFPGGSPPNASSLNFVAGQTVPNLVVVPVGADGTVSFYDGSPASLDLVVDVSGYFVGGAPALTGMFGPLPPARVLDTRTGTGAPPAPLAAGAVARVQVTGAGGVPTSGVGAVVLNLTATSPTAPGYLTVFGGGSAPTASNLNFVAGQTVPDLAFVPVADDGTISVRNGSPGTVDVLADVTGYVRSTDLPVPGASVSRYVTDLRGAQSTSQIAAVMKAHGQADAAAATGTSAHLSVLEFGAQTARAGGDGLGGGTQTGVSLVRQGSQGMRLTYPQVQAAARAYLDGYASGRPSSATGKVTVALGTNTDGFAGATYTPTAKGQDWAQQVRSAAAYGVTKSYGIAVVGADDIEADFDATASQVRSWIEGYRGGNSPPALIDNGAASGCPTTLGVTGASCGPVRVGNSDPATYNTWTQADYVVFVSRPGVTVAPQVYVAAQATQWEDIALTANGAVAFDGVLTEVAACAQVGGCTSLTPTQAWTAMNQALDADPVTASIAVPAVTDLRYPS